MANKKEQAARLAEQMATDPIHGYDQAQRWGPDYDCSSFVITVWQSVGVPVKTNGASYTGNMRGAFLRSGFSDVTAKVNLRTGSGLQESDVLLNYSHHAAMMVSAKQLVQASINERGGTSGGQTGDQTGKEISVRAYYNFPWDCVLRYTADDSQTPAGSESNTQDEIVVNSPKTPTCEVRAKMPELSYGMKDLKDDPDSGFVELMQRRLIRKHYSCGGAGADGDFGPATREAVKNFQRENKLTVDGICGENTWAALLSINT